MTPPSFPEAHPNSGTLRDLGLTIEGTRLEPILDEIARITRPGGTSRSQPGEAERARVNVYRAIRKSIEKIREQDLSLAHHLDHDIRTGTYCSYDPDAVTAPDWAL